MPAISSLSEKSPPMPFVMRRSCFDNRAISVALSASRIYVFSSSCRSSSGKMVVPFSMMLLACIILNWLWYYNPVGSLIGRLSMHLCTFWLVCPLNMYIFYTIVATRVGTELGPYPTRRQRYFRLATHQEGNLFMCGIAGILFKQQEGPIGEILIEILADLNRRGPDSTGLALYGNLPKGNLIMRIKVDEDAKQETIDWEELVVETAREFGSVKESSRAGY